MLKAVLFDLDDTLIDWSDSDFDWAELSQQRLGAMLARLQHNGQRPPALEQISHDYQQRTLEAWAAGRMSLRAPHLGRILADTLAAAGASAELLDEETLLRAHPWSTFPGVVLFEDVPDLLQLLHDNDIRVGLVTNAHQPMCLRDHELEAYGLLPLLPECRFSAADVGWLKPHPHIFRAALDCLGVQPQEAVFVGDNPVADVAGAQNAGMRGILRTGNGKNDTSMLAGLIEPDHRLDTLAELPAVLDGWFPGWR